MKAAYDDIKNAINMEPLWYDQNGVPRYAEFGPEMAPDIYAREVVLLRIECQACQKRFWVEMHSCDWPPEIPMISDDINDWLAEGRAPEWFPIHYGDPPIHDCPGAGNVMNCEDLYIAQFWKRGKEGWYRVPELEVILDEDMEGGEACLRTTTQ